MIVYKASADVRIMRAESFQNIFRSEEEVFVELPGSTSPIRIPNDAEHEAYFWSGPAVFSTPGRFEEVRAYMRHYFVDADSVQKHWKHRAEIDEAIRAALESHSS